MIFTKTRGVIEIIGEHDVGKTIAALQVVNPYKNTAFVDDDIKGDGTMRQMKEGGIEVRDYVDLAAMRIRLGRTPTATDLMHKVVDPTVEYLLSGKRYDVIIWDTWRIVYEAARGHVDRNQSKYSNVVTFRGNSIIIQGLVSKVARMIEREYIERLRNACDLLVLTHHVKDYYLNNVVVGKIPESSKTLNEVCNMRVWLRRNPRSKVPIILFLKRPSMPSIAKTGAPRFVNIVPLKITPTEKDESIWGAISRYEQKPIENRQPTADETPTKEEFAAISGTMTEEQKQYAKEMLRLQAETTEDFLGDLSKGMKQTEVDHPANGTQLLTMSANRYSLDSDEVLTLLDLDDLGDVFSLTGKALEQAWKTIKEHGE